MRIKLASICKAISIVHSYVKYSICKKQKLLEGSLGDHFSYQFGERVSIFKKKNS